MLFRSGVMAPGLGFAFGFDGGESYVNKAMQNNWLIVNDSLTTPATYSVTEDFKYTINIEPFKGFKVDLNGARVHTNTTSNQFMFSDIPNQKNGSFTITMIALKTSLGTPKADNNYKSKAFENLVEYRNIIAQRLNNKYIGTTYPTGGLDRKSVV